MRIVKLFIERPGLERALQAQEFRNPLQLIASEHGYLRRVLDSFVCLADDLHAADREQIAASVMDYISLDLKWLSADHEALVGALERKTGAADRSAEVASAVRNEHAAMGRLLPQVLHGLRLISSGGFPENPRAFAVAALVFCEFVKLHTNYEDAILLPLARHRLMATDLDDIAIDMALRRGMCAI
jgi:hypothetical protein